MKNVEIVNKKPGIAVLHTFLSGVNCDFSPCLSERVNIQDYVHKLVLNAEFLLVYEGKKIIAALIYYVNAMQRCEAYVTNLAVCKKYQQRGYARLLLTRMKESLKTMGCKGIRLEVDMDNTIAFELYRSAGFVESSKHQDMIKMICKLGEM